jgi:hypothetical protein
MSTPHGDDDGTVSPGALPPVATEDALAGALDRVANGDGVVSRAAGSLLDQVKAETGRPKGELTLSSTKRDPLNAGATALRHRVAAWGALLWKHAVASRRDDAIHGRGVHYVTVSTGVTVPSPNPESDDNPRGTEWTEYANTQQCYEYLADALKNARVLGYIPQTGIIDEKNTQYEYRTRSGEHTLPDDDRLNTRSFRAITTPSPPSFSASARRKWGEDASGFNPPDTYADLAVEVLTSQLMKPVDIDAEAEQPYHVEVWSEKSLPSEVRSTVKRAGAGAVVEGEGCMSLTQAFEFGERVERVGKPAVVLYLADFDPAGDDMPAQAANKFEWLVQNPQVGLPERVYVERAALTAAQVAEHDLPRQPLDVDEAADRYAARIEDFEERHGAGATELNALEADLDLYQRIVRDAVEQYRDPDLHRKAREARDEYEDACEQAIRDAVDEAGVAERLDELGDWLQRARDVAAEYEEAVGELHEDMSADLDELKDEDAYTEFKDAHESVGEHVDEPEFDPPDGEVSPPDDPLYDSEREYLDTVRRARSEVRADGGDDS